MNFLYSLIDYLNLGKKPENQRRFSKIYALLITVAFALFAVFGIGPTLNNVIFALQAGIPLSQVSFAREQSRLWSMNVECFSTMQSKTVEIEQFSISDISVMVCPSGSILVQVYKNDGEVFYRWITQP